jgi:hypothetical protein
MIIYTMFKAMVLTAITIQTSYAENASDQAAAEPCHATRQNDFKLPFQLDVQASSEPIGNVELLYSTDRGGHWFSYGKLRPEKEGFYFRAPHDGEYWFQMRLLSPEGEVMPLPAKRPRMRVLVDTTPPKLHVSARQEKTGQVTASWNIHEAHLSSEIVAIHFRYDDDRRWHPLAIDRGKVEKNQGEYRGETSWWPREDSQSMELRCEARDLAGNRQIENIHVDLTAPTPQLEPLRIEEEAPFRENSKPWNASTSDNEAEDPPLSFEPLAEADANWDETMQLPPPPVQKAEIHSRYADASPPPASSTLRPRRLPAVDPPTSQAAPSPASTTAYPSWSPNRREIPKRSSLPEPHQEQAAPETTPTSPTSDQIAENDAADPGIITHISLMPRTANRDGYLLIRWNPGGESLAHSTLDMMRGPTPEGPWRTIANQLPNTGSHRLPLEETTAGKYHLRLELFGVTGEFYEDTTSRPIVVPASSF